MSERILICTDLDRTLIPNGPQKESAGARKLVGFLAQQPAVSLAFVSGRDRQLVEEAINDYSLPIPDYVIGDVGTTIYHVGATHEWRREQGWEIEIARDWKKLSRTQLQEQLDDIPELILQEEARQNDYKLSYYAPMQNEYRLLSESIQKRLSAMGINARLIWSIDETSSQGLLDILPQRASKYHAIRALMKLQGFDVSDTVFCGDSGNDIEVLSSSIPAVLVANALPVVRADAQRLSDDAGFGEQLYLAQGDFMGMNGNYSAGMLEGITHFHPQVLQWISASGLSQDVT